MSLHVPWDLVDDFADLARHAKEHGVTIGMINSNLFQDDDYKLGSLTHSDPAVRRKAVAHHVQCIDVMRATGSKELKVWLPDGTNYPRPGLDPRPSGPARRVARGDLRRARRRPPHGARVQVLRAGVLPHGRAGLGAPPCCTAWPSARRRTSCWTRATTRPAPTSSSSWRSCCARAGSGRSTSTRASTPTTTHGRAADPFQLFRIMHEIVQADALRPESGG